MIQRVLAALVLLTGVLAAPEPVLAAPGPQRPGASGMLADADHDGVSDGLEAQIDSARPGDLVDVVVTWTGPAEEAEARRAVGAFEVRRRFDVIDGFSATMTVAQARALAVHPGVFRVEEDFEVTAVVEDADRDYGTERARAEFGVDGSGVTACILDTGADPGHEQLDGKKVTDWIDLIGSQPQPYDDHGHGTHVASILAGDGTGGSAGAGRYQGVAPGASIAAAKVLNSLGSGSESVIIAGIDWCVGRNADLISMSLGTSAGSDGSDALSQAVDNAVLLHGITVVVAAGNSGDGPETVGSPGAAREALTIGASAKLTDGLRLAPFSSRGPTLDGRPKPDVIAPGVGVIAAEAGTNGGYVAHSGTSMATPFAAGAVALALEVDSSLTPADVKADMTATSLDLGPVGPDGDWGWGLLDGYGFLAHVAGGAGAMELPAHDSITGAVADGGVWTHTFALDAGDLGLPVAATILIDGAPACSLGFLGFCLVWEWGPDLEARLVDPGGTVLATSECPAYGDCGAMGAQETLVADATVAGDYSIEIWPFAEPPNNGEGGGFAIDLFTGPTGTAPPPDPNLDPAAVDDSYVTDEDTQLVEAAPGLLGNDSDPDGDPITVTWHGQPANGTVSVGADGGFTYVPDPDFFGPDTFGYAIGDGGGGSAAAIVEITVNPVNDPPIADAGADQTVADADGDGFETVTLDGSGSADSEGPLTYAWSEKGAALAEGVAPEVVLAVGAHTVTLTVTDTDGAVDDDVVAVTILEQQPPQASVHVGDLDVATTALKRGRWRAIVSVLVHGDDEAALGGAEVTFDLGGGSTASCTTRKKGRCTVRSGNLSAAVASFTFTVADVAYPGRVYLESDNHDPDADGDGTSITALKPG